MKTQKTEGFRRATCCVIGCGPAGAMLGLMLAREGVDVLVLEKHADFLRDFRGDTIHPSTMEIMDELGLAEGLLDLEHMKAPRLEARLPGGTVTVADLRRLKTRYPYITFMPQWDFLDYVTREAKRYPNFRLEMNAEARVLILEDGVVRGVRYETPEGSREARALLTVAADGRSSPFREQAGLKLVRTSPPIDVLWFRLSRRDGDPKDTFGYAGGGRFMVVINRGEYWQIAYVIKKGEYQSVHDAGLSAFRRSVGDTIPDLADRTGELQDWEAALRAGRPAAALAQAGATVHRGCCACYVSRRRRRHQPRYSRRGRGGECPGRTTGSRTGTLARPGSGAAQARATHARDTGIPVRRPTACCLLSSRP
jgi:2-polyprenyl-6-methoxyphenol hydroxylase-like FAD-dependent oxidoreductase